MVDSVFEIDAIVSGEVVEHIPIKELVNLLSDFYNILSPSGVLLITTPNPNFVLIKFGRTDVLKDPSHINIMKPDFLMTLLEKIGFSNVGIKGSAKMTNYLGENFPVLVIYGSFMIIARK